MTAVIPAPEIFKAYDIRGIVDRTLTVEGVRAIGHALGSEARSRGQRAIAVGRDGRLSGPALAGALADGIRAELDRQPVRRLFVVNRASTGTVLARQAPEALADHGELGGTIAQRIAFAEAAAMGETYFLIFGSYG